MKNIKVRLIHMNTDITTLNLVTANWNDKIAWIVVDDGKSKRLFFEQPNIMKSDMKSKLSNPKEKCK